MKPRPLMVGGLIALALMHQVQNGFAQLPEGGAPQAGVPDDAAIESDAPAVEPDTRGINFDDVYESGRARYADGDYLGAIAIWSRLARTLSEEETFKLHYSIALAHQNLGDATSAIEGLTRFLAAVDRFGLPKSEQMMATDAKARLASLRATYAEVTIPAPQHGGPMLVKVGVSEPRVAGFTLYLSPGTHLVELDVGTPNARTQRITAQAGMRLDIDTNAIRPAPLVDPPANVRPGPLEPLAPVRPSPPPESAFPLGIVLGLGSATLVSFALPIGFFVHASSERSTAAELGPDHPDYPQAQRDFDNARSAYEISWLAPGVLGAATLVITTIGLVQWAETSNQYKSTRGMGLSVSDRGNLQWQW